MQAKEYKRSAAGRAGNGNAFLCRSCPGE